MLRLWVGAFGVLVALAALPAAAEAQARTCRQVLPSDFRRIVNVRGQEIVYFRDPVRVLCTGGIRLEADSAVMNRAAGTVELVGSVVYQDSTRELEAGWANYLGRVEQLLARDDIVLRDLEGGSVITGDDLNYLRETDTRPTARMVVTGERPYAVIPPPEDTAAPPPDPADTEREPAEPTEVWASRMEMRGEELFIAEGSVDLKRGDMTGAGEVARFDRAADRMTLIDSAFVRSDDYRLAGDRIDAFLEGGGIREVRSEGSAHLTSADLDVEAERVRIGFADGELERLEAWNPEPEAGRARAAARDFRLRADSLDVQADSLGVRELRAVGRAYGERDLPVDSLVAADGATGDSAAAADEAQAARPVAAASPALAPMIARDWIQGDTILGFFEREPADTAAGDLAAAAEAEGAADSTRTVLERIVVVGGSGPALSLYRMASETGGQPAINFMKAQRIILFMEQGDVARVEAEGPIEGMYLDPAGGGAPTEEPAETRGVGP